LMYVKSGEARGVRRLASLAGLAAVAAVGIFSKESAVVLAAVIVLYEATWWQRDRSVSRLLRSVAAIAPPLVVYGYQRSAVLSAALTAEFPFTDNPITGAGFWIGRLTAIRVMARYLALIAWPAWLSCDYSYAQIPLARGTLGDWAAAAVIAAVSAAVLLLFHRHRGAFFFGAFAFLTFLPASNLLFPTGTIMAERLVYLPSLGAIGIAVIATFVLAARIRVRSMAPIAICLLASGFAVRTWTRNLDWQNDVTLWSRATETSPMSSKAHRALAEALYDADPTHANLDRVIAEAERSMAIQSDLPDTLKSPQSYRQVAAYYLDRADLLRRGAKDGRAASTPEATRAYQRALDVARQCLSIIEIGSAKIAGASTAPAADAYRLLAGAYLGLQDPEKALDAATRARTLEPSHPLGYRQTAAALLDEDRPDEAAVSLVVGFMVTGDAGLRQEVLDLYRAGLDDKGCAIRATPNGPVFDPSCDIVRRHLCAAAADTMRVYQQMGRGDRAEALERSAAHDFGCDPAPLERVLPGSR
jgi:tetratricopeptide (TPR) repeat protein